MNRDLIATIIDVVLMFANSALGKLIKDAIASNDPAELLKVTDVLPHNVPMKSRLALILAKAEAKEQIDG